MEPMNENEDAELKESRFITYLTVTAKIAAYIFLMFVLTAVCLLFTKLFQLLFPTLEVSGIWDDMIQQTCLLAGTILTALILLKSWDHLPFANLGLSLKGRAKDIFWGTLVALIIYVVGFGVLYGLGEVTVVAVHFSVNDLLISWVLMLLVAVTEEVAFRGFVLGHLLNAGINRFTALLLSSALFSLMHIFNPNFSVIAFLNIFLAGVLMGSTYVYTRNLCFPIALHLFWNWFQGPVLGFGVSGGNYDNTLLTLNFPEENLINGGAFGFESSILCTALIVIAIVVILRLHDKFRIRQLLSYNKILPE